MKYLPLIALCVTLFFSLAGCANNPPKDNSPPPAWQEWQLRHVGPR